MRNQGSRLKNGEREAKTFTGFMLLRTFVVLAMSRDACSLKQ
jgi:hypothetical protein